MSTGKKYFNTVGYATLSFIQSLNALLDWWLFFYWNRIFSHKFLFSSCQWNFMSKTETYSIDRDISLKPVWIFESITLVCLSFVIYVRINIFKHVWLHVFRIRRKDRPILLIRVVACSNFVVSLFRFVSSGIQRKRWMPSGTRVR